MEKVKIVFFSYGEKETVIVPMSKYFDRLLGRGEFIHLPIIDFFNSQKVEVYLKNDNDKRKWYLWKIFTTETFPTPLN